MIDFESGQNNPDTNTNENEYFRKENLCNTMNKTFGKISHHGHVIIMILEYVYV
jgi:hypothetical protein